MRQASHTSWASGDDNTGFFLIVIIAGLAALSYVLWANYHGAISAGVIALRHAEICVIRHFTAGYDLADRQMLAADPEGVTLRDLYGISHAIGMFVRLPAVALILLLAMICFLRAAPARFRRAFDLDGLIAEQAASFPTVAAFVRRRLRLVPIPSAEPRPADAALTPEEWLATYATDPTGAFDELRARAALRAQLGPAWTGLAGASPQARCLLAAFALHLARRGEDALSLLGRLSAVLDDRDEAAEGPEQPLALPEAAVAAADAVLRNQALLQPALAIMTRHAYTRTGLMALLNDARHAGGVLAPGQFAWLKLVDRPLWYALHSLGFESEGQDGYLHPNPRVEAVGARDHWAAERFLGVARTEPCLDRAIAALRRVHAAAAGRLARG